MTETRPCEVVLRAGSAADAADLGRALLQAARTNPVPGYGWYEHPAGPTTVTAAPVPAAQPREQAERVLLARCCEHPPFVTACECGEQVGADVDALDRAGLLCPAGPTRGALGYEEGDPMTPVLADDRRGFRTELIWAPAGGSAWSEHPGWTLYVDATPIATTPTDLTPEAAQQWANARLGEGLVWECGHRRWYFVATPHQSGRAPR